MPSMDCGLNQRPNKSVTGEKPIKFKIKWDKYTSQEMVIDAESAVTFNWR